MSVCVLGLLAGPTCFAQTKPEPLALQAAMERALASNPSIAAARLRSAIDRAGRGVAGERLNPEVSVELEKETPKQSYTIAVPLELGGKRGRRIAVSEAALRSGEAEVAATVAQVRNDVRRAYFDLLVADAKLDLMRELRELASRARDTAQARFQSGDVPRLELLQAGLALASAENEATAAEGAVRAARARLNALLGQPLDLMQSLSTPIDSGGTIRTDAVVDLAISSSSELTVIDRRIEEQRARLQLANALRRPDLTGTAALTHDSQPEFDYGWRAGFAVTLPIFTTHKAGVLLEQATLDQLLSERQATLARIRGDVTAAAASAEAERTAYVRYHDVILPQAQEVEQLAQDSYQLGQTGIAVLLQALQASRDLRLRSLDTVALYQAAVADLERAIGAPLP
jgi:cobalt-zinc-cadmium efflux system outer membrane protein